MKRTACLLTAFAVTLASAAPAAVSKGAGGRIYLSGRYDDGTNKFIRLKSLAIDANWSAGAVISHGDISDMVDDGGNGGGLNGHLNAGLAPQIIEANPSGYATLVFSAFWTNGAFAGHDRPLSVDRGVPSDLTGTHTMGLLKVNPTAGGMNIQVLTAGRPFDRWGGGWWTGGGQWFLADPNGTLSGTPGSYTVSGTWSGGHQVRDMNSDGDIANDNADYFIHGGGIYDSKSICVRSLDNRGYIGLGSYPDSQPPWHYWGGIASFSSNLTTIVCAQTNGLFGDCWRLAVGNVTVGGNPAVAVYANVREYIAPWPYVDHKLVRFLDTNDDGVADQGDVLISTVGGSTNPLIDLTGFGDMRFVKSAGKTFLVLTKTTTDELFVQELNDDGSLAAGSSLKIVSLPAGTLSGAGYTLNNLAFDTLPTVPPPQGTVVLLR